MFLTPFFLPFSIIFLNRLKEIKANKGEKETKSLHHFWQKCHCRLKIHWKQKYVDKYKRDEVQYKCAFTWKTLIKPLSRLFSPSLAITEGLTKSATYPDRSLSLREWISTRWTDTSVWTSTDFTVRLLGWTCSWDTCSAQSNKVPFCAHRIKSIQKDSCLWHWQEHPISTRTDLEAFSWKFHCRYQSPQCSQKRKNKAVVAAREQQSHGELADARMLLKFNEKWQLEKCCCFREKNMGDRFWGER